ncbi:MAG: cellulase family glycosylhydrolase [Proteobacteria bacterium]|nr:cellulase family glycosylhydrolase [Pseudomonadota bacterium]
MVKKNKYLSLTFIIICLLLNCGGGGKGGNKLLHADGLWIKDQDNRVVILRGINAGGDAKLPPFLPFNNEASADQIAGWGMNVARYLVTWEGIEPEKGVYSEEYLEEVEKRVNWLTQRGIFVFIDFHQDLFARRFCGDGAPEWTCSDIPVDPVIVCGPDWFTFYLTDSVLSAFDRFWKSDELQNHYAEAFRMVAGRFAGNPRVIGYEIMNEPWSGSIPFYNGDFEINYLAPFYRKVISAIREKDKNTMVFFEPVVTLGGFGKSYFPRLSDPRLVFSPHFYTLGSLQGNEPSVDDAVRNIDQGLGQLAEKANQLSTPVILGEYGVHPNQVLGDQLLKGYYQALDHHLMGGTVWSYAPEDLWNHESVSLINPDYTERPYMQIVDRPYPMAIDGEPQAFLFNDDTGVFTLEAKEPSGKAPTLVYLSAERHYPNGFQVELSSGTSEFDPEKEILSVSPGAGIEVYSVTVSPQ